MNNIIPIFFTIDNDYAKYVSVAIKSLLDNASKNYFYNIHIVHENLSNENKDKLNSLLTPNAKIIYSEMNNKLKCITNKLENRLRTDTFTLTIFFRIFIPEMFPEYKKAIYIDSDTCITGDISKLYNIDLKNNLLGGCVDTSCFDCKPITDYFTNVVGVDYKEYINSGILLMNMEELRNVNISDKFLYLYNKYHFENVDPDQAYINAMCKNKIMHLDNSWDTMPDKTGIEIKNPNIIHYNLFLKPWHYENIAYESYFWKYAKLTPYYEEILKIKNEFNEEEKDKESLNFLLKRCEEMLQSKETFKTVFESGKEERL